MHVAIIGAYGSAGVAVAERLADADEVDRLTLLDGGEPGGGLCILRGCMPSKEVLSAAAHRYHARHDERLVGDPPDIDLERVVASKDAHITNFAEHRRSAVHSLAEREGVEFVHENARFTGARTLAVGDRELTPDYVVVATGSAVNVPDTPGLNEVPYSTSADVLDATEFGESGIVMGFGYVGVELAAYLSEAGVDVTVIEHDDRPMDEADDEFGDDLLALYREEFDIDVRTNVSEQRVERTDDGGVRMYLTGESAEELVEADQLFLFTGRRPNVDGLNLDAAGLKSEEGWVEETMQARDDDRVFVVGDVNGHEPILHVAKEQGFLAADNVLAHAAGEDLDPYENVHHHVIFSGASVYPYVRVGHSEESAADAGLDAISVSRQASDDGVFKTKYATRGRAKLVVDADDGTVLGYQGLHYHADVMAKTMQVVVERQMRVDEIPDRAYHPTTPEIIDGLLRAAKKELR
ncbi:pyridine nucleotide-disulfide oxidoreductase [Haloprofundus marisrubri]|uniref:Pyridine nucleotide-disulfide oxidoreductase n=1 Tax=Haloprofundus marisrubri TaxID=1514971 RepID=A0A0W1RB54_9EURY|nr:NAD(P)/FAD-dependent oxidoreductase [Haloprofundus marisrubri]KTG10910.1 pyridine nucleotide-disulfide oxidoreductase [Haloprofundus marisrubri]